MFRQLRLWVWVLWAATLLAAIMAVADAARAETRRGTMTPTQPQPHRGPAPSPSTTAKSASSRAAAVATLTARIMSLQPAGSATHAATLARTLMKIAPAHTAELISLGMQESSLIPQHRWYPDGSADLGVFQINSRTAMHYGCHLERLLLHDPEESVRCAARVLRDKRATCLGWGLSSEEATACYHSFSPRHRLKYMHALRRWS